MGALVAPVSINIYDSDMTHEFVVQSHAPVSAAISGLLLLRRYLKKKSNSSKVNHISEQPFISI